MSNLDSLLQSHILLHLSSWLWVYTFRRYCHVCPVSLLEDDLFEYIDLFFKGDCCAAYLFKIPPCCSTGLRSGHILDNCSTFTLFYNRKYYILAPLLERAESLLKNRVQIKVYCLTILAEDILFIWGGWAALTFFTKCERNICFIAQIDG